MLDDCKIAREAPRYLYAASGWSRATSIYYGNYVPPFDLPIFQTVRTPFDPDNFIHLTMTSEPQRHEILQVLPHFSSFVAILLCQQGVMLTICIRIMVSLIEPTKGPALLSNLLALQLLTVFNSCEASGRLVRGIAPMAIVPL